MFYLPLSTIAYQELQELKQLMETNPVLDQHDVWSYCWGPKYTAAQFYRKIHAHIKVPSVYRWLWKSCCIMRHKMFAWLVLRDRINTRDLIQRRHWHVTDDTHCELCPGHIYEDRAHLFFECNFSVRIWNYLQITWQSNDDLQAVVSAAKNGFGQPFFMEVVVMAIWNIWLLQNGKFFNQEKPSVVRWKSKFFHDMYNLQYRIKAKLKDKLLAWLEDLP
jgi:hypothetical protein